MNILFIIIQINKLEQSMRNKLNAKIFTGGKSFQFK